MTNNLPLLIFPRPISRKPLRGRGFPLSHPTLPSHERQVERLQTQMERINSEFQRFSGTVDQTVTGGEPESVLVLELANKIVNLKQAVEKVGLEWLGEWDVDLEADEDFPATGQKTLLDGCLFVSMVNQQGMDELLSLWKRWREKQTLPREKTKWRDIFGCLKNIRRWGVQETLDETGMKEYFENFLDGDTVDFQIECFYHQNQKKRSEVESNIRKFIKQGHGDTIGEFIHLPDIEFHAVKAKMLVRRIKEFLSNIEKSTGSHLFIYPSIMYFRRTGQSIILNEEGDGEDMDYPQTEAEQPPIAAILDGVPNLQHQALQKFVDFYDPFDLMEKYQPGERRHGTAMASLIIHGDRSGQITNTIKSRIQHIAVMEPDVNERTRGKKVEHFPADCFYEDRIEQAVRRIFENSNEFDALAPTVKIINISLGDANRPFIHAPSPWARLLDFLSWKYRVLFCVSAGNYMESYDFGIPHSAYRSKPNEEKTQLLIKSMWSDLSDRRLLAPAESINALTIGALHQDESGDDYYLGRRVDILPNNQLISPISRLGYGFRRSVKPEIYFPGGRQLYKEPLAAAGSTFEIQSDTGEPGQGVAWDSDTVGELSKSVYSRGTSNATALATHAGIQIHEVLSQLNNENENQIPDELMAVLIKTLLVHGSAQDEEAKKVMEHLKNSDNSRTFRTARARFLGYGAVDVKRVLECTAQRGTVLGFGEIKPDKIHEYRFPVPSEFGSQQTFRRMVVTLAWFSPINMRHRHLREAKLEINPSEKWDETSLKIKRADGDHHQVKRGTVQHEVLEGKSKLAAFQQNEEIVLHIQCKKDATESITDGIPYGLVVTLEAAEESQIPVYEKIKERLAVQVQIRG